MTEASRGSCRIAGEWLGSPSLTALYLGQPSRDGVRKGNCPFVENAGINPIVGRKGIDNPWNGKVVI